MRGWFRFTSRSPSLDSPLDSPSFVSSPLPLQRVWGRQRYDSNMKNGTEFGGLWGIKAPPTMPACISRLYQPLSAPSVSTRRHFFSTSLVCSRHFSCSKSAESSAIICQGKRWHQDY